MKKIILSLVVSILIMAVNVVTTSADIGDIEGYTTYTDIKAYINHFAIESYNVNGVTVVGAEDLRNFGFNVDWNPDERALYITRNYDSNDINQYEIPIMTAPNVVGKPAFPILSTDIKTLVNGVEARSYNVDGKTVVDFESLSAFGPVNWDGNYRTIKLWVEDGLEMCSYMQSFRSLPKVTLYSVDGRSIDVYEYEVNDYLDVGWYSSEEEARNIRIAEQNREEINKFYIGQDVFQWALIYTRYGVVKDIDYSSGKVKVYWNYAEDAEGKALDYLSGSMFASLYNSTWENASSLDVYY